MRSSANVSVAAAGGVTALHVAAEGGDVGIAQTLLKVLPLASAMPCGICKQASSSLTLNDWEVWQLQHAQSPGVCMQAGADADAEEQGGARPIEAAASAQQRDVVELLLPHTSPRKGVQWTVDAVMEAAAEQQQHHHQHQHDGCCGCSHEHEHVEEQVLYILGSRG